MKRFFSDFKKYYNYMKYAAKSQLKEEVASSYLNWLWWILDPLFFMLVYTFIATIVFKSSEPYFAVFVFIGLTVWNFFNKTVTSSIKLVTSNKDIVTKVYIPKFVLLVINLMVNLFKLFISFALVAVFIGVYQIPISINLFHFIPLILTLVVITFGISTILMHFGVFVEDLFNLMNIFLKLVFYLSGIFYLISTRVPDPYNTLLLLFNPMAYLISDFRNILIYSTGPNYITMSIWFSIGLILSIIGLKTIYKYENTYVKVIK